MRVLPSWRETDDHRGPTSPLWPRLFSWLKGPSLPGPLEGTGEKEPLSTRLEPLSWVGGGRRGFLPLPLFFITPDLRGRVLLSPGTGPGPATGAWACSAAGVVEKAPRLVEKSQVLGLWFSEDPVAEVQAIQTASEFGRTRRRIARAACPWSASGRPRSARHQTPSPFKASNAVLAR